MIKKKYILFLYDDFVLVDCLFFAQCLVHAHPPGQEHSCQCTQGNMAHLQTHQVSQEDRSRQGAETPAQVSPSHSPVSPTLVSAAVQPSNIMLKYIMSDMEKWK